MNDYPTIDEYAAHFLEWLREVNSRLEGRELEAAIREKLTEMLTEVEIITGWKLGVCASDEEAYPESSKEAEEEREGLDTKLVM